MEEKSKVKEMYDYENKIEKEINNRIEIIMEHSLDIDKLVDFIEQIRKYRTRIYELKMQLKDGIVKAYEEKKVNKLYKCISYNSAPDRYSYRDIEERKYNDNKRDKAITDKNIENISIIFAYYEREITFWQEMNVKKLMEIDQEEHFLE